jgi:hypothetical protein
MISAPWYKRAEFEIYCVTMAMRGRGHNDAVAANYWEE